MPDRDDAVVFQIIGNDSSCSECARPLRAGNFLRKEGDAGLCMDCADLAHLAFVPAGDACITRRASKHSALRFVVVKWSRARRRYERQGILVQSQALEKAEEECLADADLREIRRERDALRRGELDAAFVAAFAGATRERYHGAPPGVESSIAEHACQRWSARIGRTAAAKDLDPRAIDLAVLAHIRHLHTRYDEILGSGIDRDTARAMVRADIDHILAEWRG
jgi:hypothetical protein